MKRQTIFLITVVVVTAAIFVISPMLRTLRVVSVTLSLQPDFVATPEKAIALNSNTKDTISLLAVTEKETGVGLQARPVDPATLADLPGYATIYFGHHYTYAVSPDRKMFAVITWPGDSNAAGALHLINLNTWTDIHTDLRIDDYVSDLTFSADGRTLYWAMPAVRDPTHGMPRDYQLYGYDLEGRQLSAVTPFPSSFMPWSQHLASDKVAIFGIPTDPDNLAEDAPHVMIIDTTRSHIVADVGLNGVKAGQFREQATNATSASQGESWQYVSYSPGLAWDLDRNVLYIVHADDNKVTVVNLVNGIVTKQTSTRSPQSFLGWISDSLAPAAQAKGGPWIGARALLSRDGKRLYVFSQKDEMGQLTATNLRVIATNGMREIGHIDELLTDFALTPDGKSLLVAKGEIDKSYGFDMMVNRDIYILDAETLQERIHVRIGQVDQLWFDGFSPDGRYAYLRGSSAQWVEGRGWRNWRTMWQLLDLNSYHLISAGESGRSYGALLHIVP